MHVFRILLIIYQFFIDFKSKFIKMLYFMS